MTGRLHSVWLSSILLCSCTLDSTPGAGTESSADRHGAGWKPAGVNTSLERQRTSIANDSGNPVEPAHVPAAGSSGAHDAGSGGSGASDQAQPSAGAVKKDPAPPPSAQAGAGGANANPVAADGGKEPAAPAAGGGGMSSAPRDDEKNMDAAGAAGAAADSIRQRFIDAAIDALGGGTQDAGSQDGGTEPWRRSGSSAGGLSPEFVLPVLRTMRNSAICFRDVRRCVEMCLVLSTDCKPCAADPECGEALKDVCGPTIGSCGMP